MSRLLPNCFQAWTQLCLRHKMSTNSPYSMRITFSSMQRDGAYNGGANFSQTHAQSFQHRSYNIANTRHNVPTVTMLRQNNHLCTQGEIKNFTGGFRQFQTPGIFTQPIMISQRNLSSFELPKPENPSKVYTILGIIIAGLSVLWVKRYLERSELIAAVEEHKKILDAKKEDWRRAEEERLGAKTRNKKPGCLPPQEDKPKCLPKTKKEDPPRSEPPCCPPQMALLPCPEPESSRCNKQKAKPSFGGCLEKPKTAKIAANSKLSCYGMDEDDTNFL